MNPPAAYERLSAQDASFLVFEGPTTHMHIGGTTIFAIAALRTAHGGVDIDRIRAYVGCRLHAIPRYRQKLHFTPVTNTPVWIDDTHLNLDYHVRHTSLPQPGDDAQLKALAARIMSQQLDRSKPLWELWIVEGLRDDRFAMILKTHHSVVDGVSGVDLVGALLQPTDDRTIPPSPPWQPQRAPSTLDLLRGEIGQTSRASAEIGTLLRSAWSAPASLSKRLRKGVAAGWETVNAGLRIPASTPLNHDVGPYRRFDWTSFDLAEVKAIKNVLGGSINDVVLTVVAAAVQRFLTYRKTQVEDLDYRVVVPVSVRPEGLHAPTGNRVSAWMMSLPIAHDDPRARFAEICATTDEMKRSRQADGIEFFTRIAEYAAPIMTLGVRLAARLEPYNMIVTNVPGPQQTLYLLGAPMLAGYPQVPLFVRQGLAVALLSYAGKLHWGFNADWDLVPDLDRFKQFVEESFAELRNAAQTDSPILIDAGKTNPLRPHTVAAKKRRTRSQRRTKTS